MYLQLWLQPLSENEALGMEQMLYMREDAASIYYISNRAPKRLNNSFINQGLQVQLFLQPIRKKFIVGLGALCLHKNMGEDWV